MTSSADHAAVPMARNTRRAADCGTVPSCATNIAAASASEGLAIAEA
jgi:hypothetical protein